MLQKSLPWQPAIYEHKAALIGRTPIEVACNAAMFAQALLKEYEVYGADFLTVGLDVYNIEAEALGAELTVPGPCELVIGGDTTPVAALLKQTGATILLCDYAADAGAFKAALGDDTGVLLLS